ncbi:MAG TPA: hypothetical protein VFL47_17385, partial [Flavisolibacter sp.]|nr:hypothetical protein [Flavisolibacter sp.]
TTYNEQSKIYKPTYSGQFVPGNQVYATLVLQAWKNYEINMLDEVRGMLADTLTAVMGDGTVLKGKENFLNAIKAYRNSYSLLKVNVAAWLPTKSIDLNKETVCIWGLEDGTKTDGTAMRVAVHEVWFFNKDGKVDFFRQYIQPNPQQ